MSCLEKTIQLLQVMEMKQFFRFARESTSRAGPNVCVCVQRQQIAFIEFNSFLRSCAKPLIDIVLAISIEKKLACV